MTESIASKLREWVNTNGSICGAEDVIDSLRRYLSVLPCPEWSDDVKAIARYIADQIEAEQKAIIEAQGDRRDGFGPSAHHIMKAYADSKGMPMEDGESITQWLERYFVQRDDKPKILTANGVPLEKGTTVYVTSEHARDCGHRSNMAWLCRYRFGDPLTVSRTYPSGSVALDREKDISCPASWLTTEQPDCQERIDEDKLKSPVDYWDCGGISCILCDLFNGKRPREHYGVETCDIAQGLDLARRQAELDALLGDGTVHCKDCASSREDGHLCYRFAQGVYDEDEGADVVTPVEVEPEGSCSWGKRR